jgi:putative endonuclease
MSAGFVYIMSNRSQRIYVGATTDLRRRVLEHKTHTYPNGFTARYTFNRLVYYEVTDGYPAALKRERTIKGWTRKRKVALIQEKNPNWLDLPVDSLTLLELDPRR